jgi:hypothetical protein
MIHLGERVVFRNWTVAEVIHLGQYFWCVETGTIWEVINLGGTNGVLNLGQLEKR